MSDPKYKNIGKIEDRVIEECAEVIFAISKAKRFGFTNHHPARHKPTENNLTDILTEMKDLEAVIKEFRAAAHSL